MRLPGSCSAGSSRSCYLVPSGQARACPLHAWRTKRTRSRHCHMTSVAVMARGVPGTPTSHTLLCYQYALRQRELCPSTWLKGWQDKDTTLPACPNQFPTPAKARGEHAGGRASRVLSQHPGKHHGYVQHMATHMPPHQTATFPVSTPCPSVKTTTGNLPKPTVLLFFGTSASPAYITTQRPALTLPLHCCWVGHPCT